ncbi:MAG: DUF3047 domain-containing protein [bacterium]|nr:MAG: DUF3047 domain-containing protein [bacterium]
MAAALILSTAVGIRADDARTLFREEFVTLDAWEPLEFPGIGAHTRYSIEELGGGESCLRAESDKSASGMVWKGTFDPYRHPRLAWRWKVGNVYRNGDALSKSGDDYPMRVYVMFRYDPDDPAVRRSLKHSLARILYGRYPPYTTLTYIWASRDHGRRYLVNTYSDRALMVPLRWGGEKVGQWVLESVDILADYRAAFGEDPPGQAGLGIMNDSDNTGESSVSWIDWMEISSGGEDPAAVEE